MKTQIYNINAEKIGEMTLSSSIFGYKYSKQSVSQAIRVYLANQRSSFAKTKGRSDVAGTTKKVWAQKGTGRARHGSRKAPLFVGGGVAQGPRGLQNYTLKITKGIKQAALKSILSKFATENRIIILDKVSQINPKTKEAVKLITGLKGKNEVLSTSKKIGIVTTKTVPNFKRAFNNLGNANLLSLKSLNAYDLSKQNFLIFSKKAIQKLSK